MFGARGPRFFLYKQSHLRAFQKEVNKEKDPP